MQIDLISYLSRNLLCHRKEIPQKKIKMNSILWCSISVALKNFTPKKFDRVSFILSDLIIANL